MAAGARRSLSERLRDVSVSVVPEADAQALVALDEARRQIALAKGNGDANTLHEWRDRAAAVQHYVRRRGGAKQVGDDAGEVKVRAEAALGALDREAAPRGRPTKDDSDANFSPPLAGVDPRVRASWRTLGALSDGDLDGLITEARNDEAAVVDTAPIVKRVKAEEREARRKVARTADADQRRERKGSVTLDSLDAVTWLSQLPEYGADLLLTDPPYSTDVEDIETFAAEWLPLALSRVADHGRIYVCVGAYPRELHTYLGLLLAQERFTPTAPLIWTYTNTLGPRSRNYTLNYQPILHAYGPDAAPIDSPLIVEHVSVHSLAHPARSAERLHEWQKPDELGARFIRHATQPGATVIDPFAGTGTFVYAAARLGRRGHGTEASADMRALAEQRDAA